MEALLPERRAVMTTYRELTIEELAEWERLYDEGFESYSDPSLTTEARELLASIVQAVAIFDDEAELLAIKTYYGDALNRWITHPTVADFLVRAYGHFIARGCAASCCNLGAMYYSGRGVEQNDELACELYELGAERGDGQSCVNLGYVHYYGRSSHGVDYTRAYECFSLGALIWGNPEGYWKLGDLYAGGKGVKQNDWLAWSMYSKAYELDNGSSYAARAAHHVADYLMRGIEGKLEKDPENALLLYAQAEVGYRKEIQGGLDYYRGCLEQVIAGQKQARAALDDQLTASRWNER